MDRARPAAILAANWIICVGIGCSLSSCDQSSSGTEAADANTQAAPPPAQPEPELQPEPAPAPATPLPASFAGPVRVDPGGFDFGEVRPHAERQVEVTLTNTGETAVQIINLTPTCLCTTPENLSGVTLQPGESRPVSVGYRAPLEAGEKKATVLVRIQDQTGPVSTRLKLRGTVARAISAEPPYVSALKGTTFGATRIEADDGRPFRILSADGAPPVFTDGFDPASDEPRTYYTIQWTIPERSEDDCEGMRLWWIVETDHPDCAILPMRIRHECTGVRRDMTHGDRGWYFDEYLVPLGTIRAGQPSEVDVQIVYHKGVARPPITAVESLTEGATAELVSLTPEGLTATCRVRLTPTAGTTGMLYAMVSFKSSTGDKAVGFVGSVKTP